MGAGCISTSGCLVHIPADDEEDGYEKQMTLSFAPLLDGLFTSIIGRSRRAQLVIGCFYFSRASENNFAQSQPTRHCSFISRGTQQTNETKQNQ